MIHGDIHWALPDANGREQRGRRPAIVWQDTARFFTPTVLIVPFTTRPDALRFPATHLARASVRNGLPTDSIAMIFQLRACDKIRIGSRLGRLDDPDLTAIQLIARDLRLLP